MEKSSTTPYVFQPYGDTVNQNTLAPERMWGVSGVSVACQIKGLTKDEAVLVCDALKGVNILKEIASSGVEYSARKYVCVQIDSNTWDHLQSLLKP